MKLKRYLDLNQMSIQTFANAIGVPHETARNWVHGNKRPRNPQHVNKIEKLTRKEVGFKDLYGGSNA